MSVSAVSQAPWEATSDGLVFQRTAHGNASVLAPLLGQFEDDGLAEASDIAWLVRWPDVYALLKSPHYTAALGALRLPEIVRANPSLRSSGSLTDERFSIAISGWADPKGRMLDVKRHTGALVWLEDELRLLDEPTWALLEQVGAFARRPPEAKTDSIQRLAWARIRNLAVVAGARLDSFLIRTVVVAPQRLNLALRRGGAGEARVIEVEPSFEGAPDHWLSMFDRLANVPERYDIPTPQGIVQVVLTPAVRTVLQQIKRMPGRRVAGSRAEAFITNPFATLGEAASEALDAEQFEQARLTAELLFERFTAFVEEDALAYPKRVGIRIERAGADAAVSDSLHIFADDDELARFIAKVESGLSKGHQLCLWEGSEFELTGDTDQQVAVLRKALDARSKPRVLVSYAHVYDLSNYAARVEDIGSEKPYYSPFITKPDAEPWAPEHVQFGIVYTPEGASEPVAVPLSADRMLELHDKVVQAEKDGRVSIDWPAVAPEPIPVSEARRIVEAFGTANEELANGKFDGQRQESDSVKDGPRRRPSLLIRANIQSVDYQEARREALTADLGEPVVPTTLADGVTFLDHQRQGVAWLQRLFASSEYCRGALLADDMGLGKTFQILAFLAAAFERNPELPPALVVAPVTLLENWKEEVDKFFRPGTLPILTAYGDSLASLRIPRANIDLQLQQEGLVRFLRHGWRGNARIVLTTYETLRDLEFSFAHEKWSVMVCDEAQRAKNPNALVTRAAKKQNVQFRIACTGTPVENTLTDLWCLFDYIQPGLLGALNDFSRRYRRPIEARTDDDRARVEELRELIAPQVLRRLKKDVAKDLKQKIVVESCRRLAMSPQQRTLYARAIEQYRRRGTPGAPFSTMLQLIHHLRLLCTDPRPHGLTAFVPEPLAEARARSPKLDWLLTELTAIAVRQEKVIVFCEFREVQRMLRYYIQEVFGFAPDIINGDTPAAAKHAASRQKRIKAFQARTGFGVVILSPVAVGFGVNIQGANHVMHYSRTWNPAKEDQATDRAYRIGQLKDVYVYYPVICADDFTTFDVRLDQLLTSKRALADDMLNGTGDIAPNELDPSTMAPAEAGEVFEQPITVDELLRLDFRHFEGLIAALWQKRGFRHVQRTSDSGDDGVDVVAIATTSGELVQCKSTTTTSGEVSWEAVQQVVAGEAAYRVRHPGVTFARACATNGFFNDNARRHATLNSVDLYDRDRITELLHKLPVTMTDVERTLYVSF